MEMLLYSNFSVEMLEIVRSSVAMQTEIAADCVQAIFIKDCYTVVLTGTQPQTNCKLL